MFHKLTVRQFFDRFPDDQACLDHIMQVRYGRRHRCERCFQKTTFHKITERRAYACSACGHHVYPCAGTIFEDSRTPLQVWFYAIYLFVVTRHGVSGKELQRSLGVTYKCAWRIGHQVRRLMAKVDGFEQMQGHIEADETYIGGRKKGMRGRTTAGGKTIVMGLKERGGRMYAQPIPDVKLPTLRNVMLRTVAKGSTVSTDELVSYDLVGRDGYRHGTVKHSQEQYVAIDPDGTMHHTNSVESFWKLFKHSIRSTHISVSGKYMDAYLKEFTCRANHRAMRNGLFDLLIAAI